MMTDQLFTEGQLNQLRVEFATINRIDPCLSTYAKMRKLLDGMSRGQLIQIWQAKIRFLSKLALNRLPADTLPTVVKITHVN
jgi:hypothetical protein